MANIYEMSVGRQTRPLWGAQSGDAGTRSETSKNIRLSFTHSNMLPERSSRGSFTSLIYDPGRETLNMESLKRQQMRELLSKLRRDPKRDDNPFVATSKENEESILGLSGASDSSEDGEKIKKPVRYNYKEVALKIQRAKNSVSAEQAVLSAKRKVMEVKRKISAADGDPEELQTALTHARRMELVARKKKHHLELEELVVNTGKRDEKLERSEKAAMEMKNAMTAAEEQKVAEKEDAILEERESILEENADELRESIKEEENAEIREKRAEKAEEFLTELNERLSELGEEELKELEEIMEMFESMEIIDPHMSKEDLEEIKRKHRAEENKAIVKADMDYLKSMIKHQMDKAGSTTMTAGASTMKSGAIAMFAASGVIGSEFSGMEISALQTAISGEMPGEVPGGISVDVQI